MKIVIFTFAAVLLCLHLAAQTPREMWNQVPRAAGDTVAVCKTDTAKVNRYMKSLDAMIARLDALVKEWTAVMKSKEGAAQAEVAELMKNRPGAKISQAEAQRLNNMTEAQQKAYADEQLKEKTGMSMADMQDMAKKMEGASEEQQMAMAMQMMGGMDLSGMVQAEPVDDKKLKVLELKEKLMHVGSGFTTQAMNIQNSYTTTQYLEQVKAARDAAFKKYAWLDGPEGGYTAEARALHYQNFLNFMCPAVSPLSARYLNRNLALLEFKMKCSDQYEAISGEIAALEPTAVNKMAVDQNRINGYGVVREYAVELKRRYEAFFELPTVYHYLDRDNLPKDLGVYYEPPLR